MNFTNPISPRVIAPFYQSPPVDDVSSAASEISILFLNEEQFCGPDLAGEPIPAGTTSSRQSQAAANQLARDLLVCYPLFSYSRLIGSGTMYGFTEFGDLSDPPKKYLTLYPRGGWRREDALNVFLTLDADRHTEVNTSGTTINQMRLFSATPGAYGVEAMDRAEEATPGANPNFNSPYLPIWTRAKKLQNFSTVAPSAGEDPVVFYLFGLFEYTGTSSLRLEVVNPPTWTGAVWRFTCRYFIFVTSGSHNHTIRLRIVGGDQSPGAVDSSDALVFAVTTSGGGTAESTFTFDVPPDCSFRLGYDRNSVGYVSFPQAYGDPASQTDSGILPWQYAPEGPTWPTPDYKEGLGGEDTFTEALLRAVGTTSDTAGIAETSAFAGGTSGGSKTPITFTAKVPTASRTFDVVELREYRWTADIEDAPIGGGTVVERQMTGSFFTAALETSHEVSFEIRAPIGKTSEMVGFQLVNYGPAPSYPDAHPLTWGWYARSLAAGGTVDATSFEIANNLIVELSGKSYFSKLSWVLPFLGGDLDAALTPLLDRFNLGRPTNVNNNLGDGDYSLATGLTTPGLTTDPTAKMLLTPFLLTAIGSSGNGGMGTWVRTFSGDPTATQLNGFFANPTSSLYAIDISTTNKRFYWGSTANNVVIATPATVGHYYGQRSAATLRRLYIDGVTAGSNTTSDSATEIADFVVGLSGRYQNPLTPDYAPFKGSAGIHYFTNGTLSDAEVLDLHTTLQNFLMIPTGRI